MNKRVSYIGIGVTSAILILSIICVGLFGKRSELSMDDITTFETKVNRFLNFSIGANDYYLDSEEELDAFYQIYSNDVVIKKDSFDDNTVFIKIIQSSNSKETYSISDIKYVDDSLDFVVEANESNINKDEDTLWYLIAIVPNSLLENQQLNMWNRPTDVLKKHDPSEFVDFELKGNNYQFIKKEILSDDFTDTINEYVYQVNLDNNTVSKILTTEVTYADGSKSKNKQLLYSKVIDETISDNFKTIINTIIQTNDVNDLNSKDYIQILGESVKKNIYNSTMKNSIDYIINQVDNYQM